jgi:hypothetical protein
MNRSIVMASVAFALIAGSAGTRWAGTGLAHDAARALVGVGAGGAGAVGADADGGAGVVGTLPTIAPEAVSGVAYRRSGRSRSVGMTNSQRRRSSHRASRCPRRSRIVIPHRLWAEPPYEPWRLRPGRRYDV